MELRFRRCRNLPMARPDYEAGKQGDKRFLSTRMHSRTWIPRARTKSWRERERERERGGRVGESERKETRRAQGSWRLGARGRETESNRLQELADVKRQNAEERFKETCALISL